MSNPPICFIISPLGSEGSEQRKWSDLVFKEIIEPISTKCDYLPVPVVNISKPGMITADILNYLKNSELVIADLSFHNPNVFYELAIRHIINKPVIMIMGRQFSIPFDIISSRIMRFNIKDLVGAQQELEKYIIPIKRGDIDTSNPILNALDIEMLRSHDKQFERITLLLEELINRVPEQEIEAVYEWAFGLPVVGIKYKPKK